MMYLHIGQTRIHGDIRVTIYDHDDVFEALFSGTDNEVYALMQIIRNHATHSWHSNDSHSAPLLQLATTKKRPILNTSVIWQLCCFVSFHTGFINATQVCSDALSELKLERFVVSVSKISMQTKLCPEPDSRGIFRNPLLFLRASQGYLRSSALCNTSIWLRYETSAWGLTLLCTI